MKKPKIVHILANGKRVKSIEGHVIPEDNAVYQIIFAGQCKGREQEKCEKHIV